ncbi:MAG: histidine phosphatase family protein [Pseudomonadota bacterium]
MTNDDPDAPVTRWHLVRHAPVIGAGPGALGLLYATHDEPADTSDRAAFDWLANWLPRRARLITSGLKRTEATADAILAAGWRAGPRGVDARFQEQHYGDWHGAARDTLADARRAPPHNFWFHSAAERPPGGESFADVHARVSAALDNLSREHAGETIVLVGHGGTFRAALAHALGLDLDRALTISVANLSVTRIDHRPGACAGGDWRTVYVNRRPD